MSRIGKKPVTLVKGTSASISRPCVTSRVADWVALLMGSRK